MALLPDGIKDELRRFLRENCAQELRLVALQVRQDSLQELRQFCSSKSGQRRFHQSSSEMLLEGVCDQLLQNARESSGDIGLQAEPPSPRRPRQDGSRIAEATERLPWESGHTSLSTKTRSWTVLHGVPLSMRAQSILEKGMLRRTTKVAPLPTSLRSATGAQLPYLREAARAEIHSLPTVGKRLSLAHRLSETSDIDSDIHSDHAEYHLAKPGSEPFPSRSDYPTLLQEKGAAKKSQASVELESQKTVQQTACDTSALQEEEEHGEAETSLKSRTRETMRAVVSSEVFDYVISTAVLFNAFLICYQANEMAQLKEVPGFFRAADIVFLGIFTLELLARVLVYRRTFLTMKGWQYNIFDMLLVSAQLADQIAFVATSRSNQETTIRMLRLSRIIRLFRMFHLIPELRSMVYLISASMWSFFWTMVLQVLLMLAVSVYFTDLATELRHDDNESNKDNLKAIWGSVPTSMYTLFQSITGGDDWKRFVALFSESHASAFSAVLFSTYIAFATLVMLNLVAGIFVEGAQRIANEDREAEMIKKLMKLFQSADMDGSNCLTLQELQSIPSAMMDEELSFFGMSSADVPLLFRLLDGDNQGLITLEAFVKGCFRLRQPARSVDLRMLMYDFSTHVQRQEESAEMLRRSLERLEPQQPAAEAACSMLAVPPPCGLPAELPFDAPGVFPSQPERLKGSGSCAGSDRCVSECSTRTGHGAGTSDQGGIRIDPHEEDLAWSYVPQLR